MEQFKRAKVVILPTVQDSNIVLNIHRNRLYNMLSSNYEHNKLIAPLKWSQQNLYIISNDEIKEGKENVWYYDSNFNKVCKWIGESNTYVSKWFKEIISSTDKSLEVMLPHDVLIGTQLPQPSQSFITKYIEYYNKGKVITDVLVEMNQRCCKCDTMEKSINCCYSFGEECKAPNPNNDFYGLRIKVNPKNNTITIKKLKDSWNREEVIQLLNKLNNTLNIGSDLTLEQWIEENL